LNPVVKIAREKLLHLLDGGRVQLPTPVGLLEVEGAPATSWVPLDPTKMSAATTAQYRRMGIEIPDQVWQNDLYEVLVYSTGDNEGMHLSIKRYDRAPIRNWRHFQQIKNEIAGPEIEALELFPRESRLADNANQYHIWCLPPDMQIPVGWEVGFVSTRDDEVDEINNGGGPGRQEPLQEGLTIGETMNDARTPEQEQILAQARKEVFARGH